MVHILMDLCETHIRGNDTKEWIIPHEPEVLGHHAMPFVGLSEAAYPYRMVRITPPNLHILVCIAGEGMALIRDEWTRCGPGHAYISPVGFPMGFYALRGKRWRFAWIYFDRREGARLFRGPDSMLVEADAQLFENIILSLYDEAQKLRDETVMFSWAHLLHTSCLRLLEPPSRTFRLEAIWREVTGNPAFPWDVAALARRAGVSLEHLRRLSLAETGRSPMKQVANLRLHKAAHLLQTTNLKVSAIAEAVGYQDAFAFSTAFKRHLGLSPSSYHHQSTSTH